MTFTSDDLTPLLVPPPTEAVRYGQGRIVDWDPDTFENIIEWRGIHMTNLPVLAGADALTYQPGDTVGLLGWAPGGGAGSWWVLGRLVIPGSGRGADVIRWMTSELGKEISASVFAARVHTNTESGTVSTGSSSFVDLGGPEISNVEITAAGVAIIYMDCQIISDVGTGAGLSHGEVGISITGATTVTPTTLREKTQGLDIGPGDHGNTVIFTRNTTTFVAADLNVGTHQFTAQYRSFTQGTSANPVFAERSMVIIAL